MRYLIDTHSLIWFIDGDDNLSVHARKIIENEDNYIFVSIASLWEIAIKFNIGKLELTQPFSRLFPYQLEENDLQVLDIRIEHLYVLSDLPLHHRDPFDRLIICQAISEQLPIVTKDTKFDYYKIVREW